jgi:hypothetical protein
MFYSITENTRIDSWCITIPLYSTRFQDRTHPKCIEIVQHDEFLTHETTCASEMLEKTTCENFCQKRPPTSGGTPGQATRAAWASAGRPLPPLPLAACDGRRWRGTPCRHHHWRHPGMGYSFYSLTLASSTSPCRQRGWRQGPPGRPETTCRRRQRRQGPAGTGPGSTCHVSPGQGVPPLVGGLFWQKFSQVVFSSISLAQVVSYVKNSNMTS